MICREKEGKKSERERGYKKKMNRKKKSECKRAKATAVER